MKLAPTTLAVELVFCFGLLAARGQEVIPPSDEAREAIEQLEAKINRLEKELHEARQKLADLKHASPRDRIPDSRPIHYLRFPIEVERAMMGEGMLRARQLGGSNRTEGNRRNKFKPQLIPGR